MTAFGTPAKMEPPAAGRQAFYAAGTGRLGQGINTISLRFHVVPWFGLSEFTDPQALIASSPTLLSLRYNRRGERCRASLGNRYNPALPLRTASLD
jgi:hypothetical protein